MARIVRPSQHDPIRELAGEGSSGRSTSRPTEPSRSWLVEIAAALAAASQNLRRLIHFLQDRLALKRLSAKNRNHWMTYAKPNRNARVEPLETTEADSEPVEYYLIPGDDLFA